MTEGKEGEEEEDEQEEEEAPARPSWLGTTDTRHLRRYVENLVDAAAAPLSPRSSDVRFYTPPEQDAVEDEMEDAAAPDTPTPCRGRNLCLAQSGLMPGSFLAGDRDGYAGEDGREYESEHTREYREGKRGEDGREDRNGNGNGKEDRRRHFAEGQKYWGRREPVRLKRPDRGESARVERLIRRV